jgi:2-amino-4-hydroxy-6-hydroxymethyldihydropteridine diphosphokinase
MMVYYLSLGSNLGDRTANIERTINFLRGTGDVLKISSIYETEPMGMAPGAGYFYNLVIGLQTSLSPHDLLEEIKRFEKQMGRDIIDSHNQPRPIDIDILLAGNQAVNAQNLVIPHKQMHKRAFVLVPLNEIAPHVIHPVLKKTVKKILSGLQSTEMVKKNFSSCPSCLRGKIKSAGNVNFF